ncbi:MAG: FAD-dependent monooxygenase, partial [Nostoc sp.]
TAYWLPRASFVELLYQEIHQHWQDSIQVLFNTECIEIKQHLEHLEVITQSQYQEKLSFIPTLIVGCDGFSSIVRQTLHQMEGQSHSFEM